jgi:hypothetical protein
MRGLIKYLLVLAVLPLQLVKAAAPDVNYAFAAIPEELLKNANAVVRSQEESFVVLSPGKASSKEKLVITILNQKAHDLATKMVGYDNLNKLSSFKAVLYDASGKQVKKLKTNEFKDYSATDGGTIYSDSRVKVASFDGYKQYPFTVEFEHELIVTNMMFYPTWYPQFDENLAVEKARLQVEMPAGMALRYKEVNIDQQAEVSQVKGNNTVYTWQLNNVAAIEMEPWGPHPTELVPVVYTAPSEFEVQGYKGTMNSWKELGEWQNKLNTGRDVLPKATQDKLLKLVEGEKSKVAQVKKIYEYLQANTRYISVQVGIGGWQPFEASFVDSKGYGDCKALSNYTYAMLKAIGIQSCPAIIMAGRGARDMQADFPNPRANHMILCVPMEQDTVWLECTSQQNPFDYMGSFTGNRHALLATPEGGKLVRTHAYGMEDNKQFRRADIVMDKKGNAKVKAVTTHTGIQQEEERAIMENPSTEEQKKELAGNINIPDFTIESFQYSGTKDRIPTVTEKVELSVNKCGSINGKRLFLKPNLMNQLKSIPAKVEERKSEIVVDVAFIDSDTMVYTLPDGYALEFKPENTTISSGFGEYSASVAVNGSSLTYIRTFSFREGRYPAASYTEFIEFWKKIVKADAAQVVLVTKEI